MDIRVLTAHRSTRRLAIAYFLSKCGEFAFEAAFVVAIVNLTDADLLLIGFVYFCRYMPCLLFSPVGGWLADNVEKKYILVTVELLRCVVAAVLFASFVYGEASVLVATLAAMLMTAFDCLYDPAFRAYFPTVVARKDLPAANSGLQVIEDIASITGPLIFSFITVLLAPVYAFAFFSAALLVSAACTVTLHPSGNNPLGRFNVVGILVESVCNVGSLRTLNPPLFAVVGCTTVCAMFATSITRFILPAAVIEHFQSEAAVGYVYALFAAGSVLGGLLYVKFNRATTAHSVVRYWCVYGVLFSIAAVALQFNTSLFLSLLLCAGFFGAFVDIAIITNIQCLSKPQEVGKNFSLYYSTAIMGDALSGLVASLMFLVAGPATFISMTLMLGLAPLAWLGRRTVQGKQRR